MTVPLQLSPIPPSDWAPGPPTTFEPSDVSQEGGGRLWRQRRLGLQLQLP